MQIGDVVDLSTMQIDRNGDGEPDEIREVDGSLVLRPGSVSYSGFEYLLKDLRLSAPIEKWLSVQIDIAADLHKRGEKNSFFYQLEERTLNRILDRIDRLEAKGHVREEDANKLKQYLTAFQFMI